MTERDMQRQKLYDAERVLDRLARPVPTMDDVRRLVERVFASKRVHARWPMVARFKMEHFRLRDGRGSRHATGDASGISIPLWARKDWVILHELAHTIHINEKLKLGFEERMRLKREDPRQLQGHGSRFAAIYLDLVLLFMGRVARDELRASFRRGNVRYKPKRRMTPEALQRLAVARAKVSPDTIYIARSKRK